MRLPGKYANVIPLPKALAEQLFFCQGKGTRVSADHCLLDTTNWHVDTDTLVLTEPVRNLRVWLTDSVWEWDSAGSAWVCHYIVR